MALAVDFQPVGRHFQPPPPDGGAQMFHRNPVARHDAQHRKAVAARRHHRIAVAAQQEVPAAIGRQPFIAVDHLHRLAIGRAQPHADPRRAIGAAGRGKDQDRLAIQRDGDRRVAQQARSADDQLRQFGGKGQTVPREMALAHDRIGVKAMHLRRGQPPFLHQPVACRAQQRRAVAVGQAQIAIDGHPAPHTGKAAGLPYVRALLGRQFRQ